MKRFLLFLLCGFTLTTVTCSAQIFQKSYGGTGGDWVNTVLQTFDGGYLIGGFTNSYPPANGNFYLLKTTTYGDTLWTKTYGEAGWEYGNNVQQCTDSGFIFIGRTTSFGAGQYDVYLVKTDASGNLTWSKTYGGNVDESGKSVQQTLDGGYIMTGYTKSFGAGNADFYLLKTNAAGALQWSKTYGGNLDDFGYAVQQCPDSGYIISGYTCSYGVGACDALLIKTDKNGDTLWTKTYGGSMPDGGYSVAQCVDGGFIMTGKTNSFGVGSGDVLVLKTDSNGTPVWSKTFGAAHLDFGTCVKQTNDGGFIISGLFTPTGTSSTDIYLVKTDAAGDTLWTKTYGGSQEDEGAFVSQTTDNGFIVGGWTVGFGLGDWEICLIKTDSLGNSICNLKESTTSVNTPAVQYGPVPLSVSSGGIEFTPLTLTGSGTAVTNLCSTSGLIQNPSPTNSIVIFPNPSNGNFSIHIPDEFLTSCRITLLNTLGDCLIEQKVPTLQEGNYVSFNFSDLLPAGAYYLKVTGSSNSLFSKIIIQK